MQHRHEGSARATLCLAQALVVYFGCGFARGQETTETTLEEETTFSLGGGPSYLLSSDNTFSGTELLWPGFLT